MKKIVIVGGVAGGATAATRLRRLSEEDQIIVLEKSGYVSFANCGLPYYLGGVIKDRARLLQETPESLNAKFNLDVRVHNEALFIDRAGKTIHVKNLENGTEYDESYDKLILTMGASPRKIPFEGLDKADNVFYLRNIEDVDAIFSSLERSPKTALIVGGGFIGVETAENFALRGIKTTLVEGRSQILPPFDHEMARLLENELVTNGIRLKLGVSLSKFQDNGHTVVLADGETLPADIVILSIGIVPDNVLAKSAGLALSGDGYVLTNEKMETTDMATGKANEDVYAIGDVALLKDYIDGTTTHIALAGPANRQARLVADVINGLPYTYKGAIGTSVLKVFSLTGASTGYSEALCQRKNLPYQSVIIERNQHAGYYPGASIMTLKVVFNPKDGSLWGAQAIGLDGIEKRIDVIATALKAKMTVGDLSELELSYAPPYGSAKDVVNIAGYAAANLMEGQFKQISLDALDKEKEGAFLVDARTPLEYSLEHFDGAVNIPFVTLRKNLDKLPKDKNKKILVYCNVGMNAYLWIRIAVNLGYTNVYNIEGGMRLYKALHENVAEAVVAKEEKPMPEKNEQKVIEIDATGLQCPGPIMEASKASERLQKGDRMKIIASDCGFTSDIALWAKSTGNTLVSSENKDGKIIAVVEKGQNVASLPNVSSQSSGKTTIVLFSGDMDKALAAMIIAQGTRAMGKEATVFCTFWGLNLLRKSKAPHVKKSFIERMFGWMMPKGARKFKLSKMNMGGMGSSMMRGVMHKKNVPALEQQLASAQKAGVRFLACTMSMDIMGIKKEELIDGIDYVGVATYLSESENAGVTLFI
jgi:NADPH-dependent 2,4-dienoyl-CoA reductase/sulfur reductase-like enzyme/peroxiredoxin family protein/rhodanese-related sulfurtransferase/TusA-related sulfurtransferase